MLRYLTLAVGALLPFALAGAVGLLLFRLFRRLRPARPKAAPAPRWPAVPAQRERAADTAADVQD